MWINNFRTTSNKFKDLNYGLLKLLATLTGTSNSTQSSANITSNIYLLIT